MGNLRRMDRTNEQCARLEHDGMERIASHGHVTSEVDGLEERRHHEQRSARGSKHHETLEGVRTDHHNY